jgi:hypothetical protein
MEQTAQVVLTDLPVLQVRMAQVELMVLMEQVVLTDLQEHRVLMVQVGLTEQAELTDLQVHQGQVGFQV